MALPQLTRTQWLICFVAALGFAFDIYELLMLPLIVRPALLELAEVRPGPARRLARFELIDRWAQLDAAGAFEHLDAMEPTALRDGLTIEATAKGKSS